MVLSFKVLVKLNLEVRKIFYLDLMKLCISGIQEETFFKLANLKKYILHKSSEKSFTMYLIFDYLITSRRVGTTTRTRRPDDRSAPS